MFENSCLFYNRSECEVQQNNSELCFCLVLNVFRMYKALWRNNSVLLWKAAADVACRALLRLTGPAGLWSSSLKLGVRMKKQLLWVWDTSEEVFFNVSRFKYHIRSRTGSVFISELCNCLLFPSANFCRKLCSDLLSQKHCFIIENQTS